VITIQKRDSVTRKQGALRQLASIAGALMIGALVIFLSGYNPGTVYIEIIRGSLGSGYSISETVQTVIPLLIMALGVTICFKVKFINIGPEGQFYTGAMAATYFAITWPDLPRGALLALMCASSIAMGGLWCVIPALLKVKVGVNETLVTLMMNYIAIKFVAYLQYGPWKDPSVIGYPVIRQFSQSGILPDALGVHSGWIIAILLLIGMIALLGKTKYGYKITVLGENPNTARYAGYGTAKLLVSATFIGGGLCGIAGFIQASGVENSLNAMLSNGWGFTSIVVAWMGRLKPLPIVAVSVLIAVLIQGCTYLQISMGVPYFMASVIQAIILFFILGSDFFMNYRIVRRQGDKEAEARR
jgi:simple sugar transport system permease protein